MIVNIIYAQIVSMQKKIASAFKRLNFNYTQHLSLVANTDET